MAQIIRITSEALQATVRRLLPSQQGFGEDLQASNVIQPIIDLTPTAEGSEVRADLQTALAFGSQTKFVARNNTVTLANSGGFWRIVGTSNIEQDSASTISTNFSMSDGLSTKVVWEHIVSPGNGDNSNSVIFDYTFYLNPGDSISAVSDNDDGRITGSYRQVADASGNLINPSGFTPQ